MENAVVERRRWVPVNAGAPRLPSAHGLVQLPAASMRTIGHCGPRHRLPGARSRAVEGGALWRWRRGANHERACGAGAASFRAISAAGLRT